MRSSGYLTSLENDVTEMARVIRGHWQIESYHWILDGKRPPIPPSVLQIPMVAIALCRDLEG
jgi:hypothetical protein